MSAERTATCPTVVRAKPKDPVGGAQPELSSSIGSLKDQELMPEGENLSVECQSASQTLPERRKQRVNVSRMSIAWLKRNRSDLQIGSIRIFRSFSVPQS
jgi:hypothetical protein